MDTTVYSKEAIGNTEDRFKIKILLDIGRELTDFDHDIISIHASALEREIRKHSATLNPKKIEQAASEKKSLLACFGGEAIYAEPIVNLYDRDSTLPWFIVTTKFGRLTIGWRKRVINIDWKDSLATKYAEELFTNEDTTKGDKYIHAWGYDKAAQYIATILGSVKL